MADHAPADFDFGDPAIWASVKDAYGPGTATPDYLRAQFSDDPAVREDAQDDLIGGICHQGSHYPATLYALPILFRMIDHPECRARSWLLGFLPYVTLRSPEGSRFFGLNRAQYLAELHERNNAARAAGLISAGSSKLHPELALELELYEEANRRIPDLLPWVESDDPTLSIPASIAMSVFSDYAELARPALVRRLSSPIRALRLNAILILGALERSTRTESRAALLERFLASEDAAERMAATYTLASLDNIDAFAPALIETAAGWKEAVGDEPAVREFWWELSDFCRHLIQRLSSAPSMGVVGAYLSALESADAERKERIVSELLSYVAPSSSDGFGSVERGELTAPMRIALEAAAMHGRFPYGDITLNDRMRYRGFGLPESSEELRRWIEERS